MKVLRATLGRKKDNKEKKETTNMYDLRPEAGGRWALAMSAGTREIDLFQRYVQSTERIADLVENLLTDLLEPSYRKSKPESFWRFRLSSAAEFLAEEETNTMKGIAPEGYETLVRYYDLYSTACGKTADAIYEFLDGVGEVAGIDAAFLVLQAHNSARDIYLESIEFPAWL